MGQIYRNAKEVLIWLGPAGEESGFAFEYLEEYVRRVESEKMGEKLEERCQPDKDKFCKAFLALQSRPYWGRAWIKQEVVLAKNLVIYCGTKSVNGFHFLLQAAFYFATNDNFKKDVSELFTHRSRVERGQHDTLEVLLKKYGRTGWTDSRDRSFSLLSPAVDCEGIEDRIVDYCVGAPALFFAILDFIQPKDMLSTAMQLHEMLGVRRSQLVKFWDQIKPSEHQVTPIPKLDSELEYMAFYFVWGTRMVGTIVAELATIAPGYVDTLRSASTEDFTICERMKISPYLTRSHLVSDTEPNPDHHLLFQIDDSDFLIIAQPTLFGPRFTSVFAKKYDTSRQLGYVWCPVESLVDPERLKPYMVYSRAVLKEDTHSTWQPAGLDLVRAMMIRMYGNSVAAPYLDVICCILLELDRLSGGGGICVNDCRYVLGSYGYELVRVQEVKDSEENRRTKWPQITST